MSSVYVVCWIFLQSFQTYFCIQANSEQSDLGPHCLQKWLLKSQADDKADDNSCDWRFKDISRTTNLGRETKSTHLCWLYWSEKFALFFVRYAYYKFQALLPLTIREGFGQNVLILSYLSTKTCRHLPYSGKSKEYHSICLCKEYVPYLT